MIYQHHHHIVQMDDGFGISVNVFEAEYPKAIIMVGSALGVGQYFYFNIAKYLAQKGFVVVTHDYRGIGKSAMEAPKKGFDAGFVQLGKDFMSILEWLKVQYDNLPIMILGHSLGGIIPMFNERVVEYKSAFLVGVQTAYYKDFGYSFLSKIKTVFAWHLLMPMIAKIYGYFPSKRLKLKMEDIPHKLLSDVQTRRKFYEATDFLKNIGVKSHHLKLRCPVYAFTASDDAICTPRAMNRLLNDFIHAPIQSEVLNVKKQNLPKIGHAGFFKKKFEDSLWIKVVEWFDETLLEQEKYQLFSELEVWD
jgi:predicted alpha/beta hydrolase